MKTTAVVAALGALAQPSRLETFRLLVQHGPGGMAAGAIAEKLGLPPATLSFHLTQLAHAGLVGARRAGRNVLYAADFGTMQGLLDYLTQNCCQGACGPPPNGGAKPRRSRGAKSGRRAGR